MKLYAKKSKETKPVKTQLRVLKDLKNLKDLKTERQLKIHALTRPVYTIKDGEKRQYRSVEVPQLRISGKWLSAVGFEIGGQVKIEVSERQLVIRLVKEETSRA